MVKVCWITTLVVCWLAAARLTGVHSELFTAVVHLERMLNAEADVAEMLKSYVKNQRERLATISKYVQLFSLMFRSGHCLHPLLPDLKMIDIVLRSSGTSFNLPQCNTNDRSSIGLE